MPKLKNKLTDEQLQSVLTKLKQLPSGYIFDNYKEMASYLDLPVLKDSSKDCQLKQICRCCSLGKEGKKIYYKILDVYDELISLYDPRIGIIDLSKQDISSTEPVLINSNIKPCHKKDSYYTPVEKYPEFETMLLYDLQQELKNNGKAEINLTEVQAYIKYGLANDNYYNKANAHIDETIGITDVRHHYAFTDRIYSLLHNYFTRSIQHFQKRGYIDIIDDIWKIKTEHGHYEIASDEEQIFFQLLFQKMLEKAQKKDGAFVLTNYKQRNALYRKFKSQVKEYGYQNIILSMTLVSINNDWLNKRIITEEEFLTAKNRVNEIILKKIDDNARSQLINYQNKLEQLLTEQPELRINNAYREVQDGFYFYSYGYAKENDYLINQQILANHYIHISTPYIPKTQLIKLSIDNGKKYHKNENNTNT